MRIRRHLPIVLFAVITLVPLLVHLLTPDTPHEFDMYFHIERISAFFMQLAEHRVLPTWSTSLAHGFGSPVLLFNYALPYYLAAGVMSAGVSALTAFKVLTAITIIGMFVGMYGFLATITSPLAALVGAVWYSWAPYHFNIVELRGAIGESVAMALWPFLFWVVAADFSKHRRRYFFLGTILWALTLYAHPDMLMMIFPLWILVVLAEYLRTRHAPALVAEIGSFAGAIALMSFYFIPSYLEHGLLGYKTHEIIYSDNFVPWIQLVSQPKLLEFGQHWGRLFYAIGWPYLLIAACSLATAVVSWTRIKTDRRLQYLLLSLIMAAIGVYTLRPASAPVWAHSAALRFITYPQRFLGLTAFSLSLCAALLAHRWARLRHWVGFLMIGFVILFEFPYLTLNVVRDSVSSMTPKSFDTTDVWGEFMPKQMPADFIANGNLYATQPIITIVPAPQQPPSCTTTAIAVSCRIHTDSPVTIRFRQFNFPGWRAKVDGNVVPHTTNADGTIAIMAAHPINAVEIAFGPTPLRTFSAILSLIVLAWYVFLAGKTIYTGHSKTTSSL
jgi:hypothetical protein